MTCQDPSPPGQEPVVSYGQALDSYRSTIEACERFEELSTRHLVVQAVAKLKASGTYDPARHSHVSRCQPLTAAEHLELLAAGEMLARHYRHPAYVHDAVQAGATWPQIAQATGSAEAQVRQQYREWADSQHRLHDYYGGTIGLNDADHATAIKRAAEPPAGPENEHEAGQ